MEGFEVSIKRDDLTGAGLSGNKVQFFSSLFLIIISYGVYLLIKLFLYIIDWFLAIPFKTNKIDSLRLLLYVYEH